MALQECYDVTYNVTLSCRVLFSQLLPLIVLAFFIIDVLSSHGNTRAKRNSKDLFNEQYFAITENHDDDYLIK